MEDKPEEQKGEQEQKREQKKAEGQKKEQQEDSSFRYIVRVANTDLDGKKQLKQALLKVKGVSYTYSNMVCTLSGVDKNKRIGDMTDEEISKVDSVVRNPASYGAPEWLFNHRKEQETGADMHFISADLDFSKENDLKILKMTKSYKGLRHQWGLTLRGQRTRSNFRKNKGKGSLGVKRRAGAKAGRV